MFKLGLPVCFSLLLAIGCWFAAPAQAFQYGTASFATLSATLLGGTPVFSFSGNRPTNLGVKGGKLLACPGTPNCVNSQSTDIDKIEPLAYSSNPAQALTKLKSLIETMPRTKTVRQTSDYLYVEFTSAIMGFVDDVEFYLDEAAGVIHVRSASRLGQSDLGTNRKRIEEIRARFSQTEQKAAAQLEPEAQ